MGSNDGHSRRNQQVPASNPLESTVCLSDEDGSGDPAATSEGSLEATMCLTDADHGTASHHAATPFDSEAPTGATDPAEALLDRPPPGAPWPGASAPGAPAPGGGPPPWPPRSRATGRDAFGRKPMPATPFGTPPPPPRAPAPAAETDPGAALPTDSPGAVSPWAAGIVERSEPRRFHDPLATAGGSVEVPLATRPEPNSPAASPPMAPPARRQPAPPVMLGAPLVPAAAPIEGDLDHAPEDDRAYGTPRARLHARQLAQLMTTDNDELEAWIRRNVAAQSELARADVVRSRDILLFLAEALRTGDHATRLRILDLWDLVNRPAPGRASSARPKGEDTTDREP